MQAKKIDTGFLLPYCSCYQEPNVSIEAWFYEPNFEAKPDLAPAPIVIMAHGLASQKDMGLHVTAEQFAQVGGASCAWLATAFLLLRGERGVSVCPRPAYSASFSLQAGIATLSFDYRNFGGSGGSATN